MSSSGVAPDPIAVEFTPILAVASEKLERLVTRNKGIAPTFTRNGRWDLTPDTWAPPWTAGFLAGQLWIVADETGDRWWREQAERHSLLIEPRKSDTGTHDLGFLFTPSWGRWHAASPSARTAAVLTEAGCSLAKSYNERGRYIRTWVGAGSTLIDVMMNLDLMFQAAELSGDDKLARAATAHALTTRRYLVRGDATTAHEGWFDPVTGEYLRAETHQGYRSDSTWVRGHSWAIYGFTDCYLWTGDVRFLDTARALADTYVERTSADAVPPNDWEDPDPKHQYESSAACVASAGLLRLAEALGSGEGDRYAYQASRILATLSRPPFLSIDDPSWEGLIRKSTYHEANQLGVQESSMLGDYYYLEAAQRLTRLVAARRLAMTEIQA